MRGNPTRYLLEYSNVDYCEKQYVPDSGEWLTTKSSMDLDFPNLPYLIDGDFKLTETIAIQMYIAQKWKPELLGSTPQEHAKIYSIYLMVHDIFLATIKSIMKLDDKFWAANAIQEKIRPIVTHLK